MNLLSSIAEIGIFWFLVYVILSARSTERLLWGIVGVAGIVIAYQVAFTHFKDVAQLAVILIGCLSLIFMLVTLIASLVAKEYKYAAMVLLSSMLGVLMHASHFIYLVLIGYVFAFAGFFVAQHPLKAQFKKGELNDRQSCN